MPKRGGFGQFADLRVGLGKKEEVVFLRGGDTLMHTMNQVSQRSLFHAIFTQRCQVKKFFKK